MNALLILTLLVLLAALVLCRRVSMARAAIDLRQPVENTQRRFGAASAYYSAQVIQPNGETRTALLTQDAVNEGLLRALRNPEDL
ncbi:MAG: hypothetical protein ACK40R_00110 [Thermomonas sp.]